MAFGIQNLPAHLSFFLPDAHPAGSRQQESSPGLLFQLLFTFSMRTAQALCTDTRFLGRL